MKKLIVDTDVLIDVVTSKNIPQKRRDQSINFLKATIESGKYIGYISSITVLELFSSAKTEHRLISDLLSLFETIDLNYAIALKAGNLRREKQIGIGDAIIASSSDTLGATLVTWNVDNFKKLIRIKTPEEMIYR